MPTAQVKDLKIHYETAGEGPPLLLVMGLGGRGAFWFRQAPELSQSFTVITFDNRGVGRSDKPDVQYSVADMADDAAGLLEALGHEKAHVFGVSMGGMISQELAIRHPDRVERLVLGCTTFGRGAVPPSSEVLKKLTDTRRRPPREVFRENLILSYPQWYIDAEPDLMDRLVEFSMEQLQPFKSYMRQLGAVMQHDTGARLGEIRAPTLVITGDADILVPPENSRLIAGKIPGARLEILPGAGHCFFVQEAEKTNRLVAEFLA